MITPDDARALARHARAVVREALGGTPAVAPEGAPFDEPGAAFVSLHRPGGRLQGCIGTLEPHRALALDVAKNARAAAFDDPRARPLSLADVDELEIEVTVLGPLEPIDVETEAEAAAALRPGRDGVSIAWSRHRATFIPQMWEHFRDARTLLVELKQKAGLPADFWATDLRVWRYAATIGIDPPAT